MQTFLAAPRKEYLLNIYNYISQINICSEVNYFVMFDQLDQDGWKLFWEGCLLFPRGEILSFVNHVKDVKDIIIFAIFWPFNTLLQIIKHSKQSYIVNFTKKGLFFTKPLNSFCSKAKPVVTQPSRNDPSKVVSSSLSLKRAEQPNLFLFFLFIFYHKNLFENLGHGGLE